MNEGDKSDDGEQPSANARATATPDDEEPGADAAEPTEDLGEAVPLSLDEMTSERDEHLDSLQRVSAEFANFRRQTEKRHVEIVQQAAARVVEAILPVLDACDAAAQQEVEGIEPVAAQLRSVLEREGLEPICREAEPFDPKRHEAAMSEPGDEGQEGPIVAQVLRTGYAFNGRVLRAAMVKVKG